jgi:uncharacterized membrane protein HdeD (DUF308 family)
VLLLVWPKETLTVVAILLGAALLVAGLFRLFEGFTAEDASGATRAAYIVVGLVAAVVGLFCLRHHDRRAQSRSRRRARAIAARREATPSLR